MHPLLRRQLQRHLGEGAGAPDPAWKRLLEAIDAAYRRADEDRALADRSLEAFEALLRRERAQREEIGRYERRQAKVKPRKLRFSALLANTPLAALDVGPEFAVRGLNAAAARLFGATAAELRGHDALELLAPERRAQVAADWRARLLLRDPIQEIVPCVARDGRVLRCEWTCAPLVRSGALAGAAVLVRDLSALEGESGDLREREERYALVLSGLEDGLFDWRLDRDRIHYSDRFQEILGLAGEPASDQPALWLDRVHPKDIGQLQAALTAHFEGRSSRLEHEHRVRRSDGSWRWILVRGRAARNAEGKAVRLAGVISDVTERKQALEQMAHDARHDPLTGLPNRTLFLDLLRHSFNRVRRREEYRFGVLFIDIDRFKQVNDALGHLGGDQLLVQVARRLETCLRQGDTLARHGGDEFTICLDDIRNIGDATTVAERVHEVMREAFRFSGQEVLSSASIGIAIGSTTYAQAEDVLRDADTAMYRAKAMGKARTVVFEPGTSGNAPAILQLETDLRRALLREELRVHYMPIVDVVTGRVEGLEALARWEHPKRGLVAPAQFMALAEETGLIVPLGRWVLEAASQQLREWRLELTAAHKLSLSVNLSHKQLLQQDLAEQIDGVLKGANLLPSDLNLDISESAMVQGSPPTTLLAELHDRGLGLHMDDFGTGHSSLRFLQTSQMDSVKIDRSFVSALSNPGTDRNVVRSIVALARGLGKRVIAEGVETAEQLHYLREVGCNSAQGFFFSIPLDGPRARALIERGATMSRLG